MCNAVLLTQYLNSPVIQCTYLNEGPIVQIITFYVLQKNDGRISFLERRYLPRLSTHDKCYQTYYVETYIITYDRNIFTKAHTTKIKMLECFLYYLFDSAKIFNVCMNSIYNIKQPLRFVCWKMMKQSGSQICL